MAEAGTTFIRKVRHEGHCVVFSSHVMQEVAALCDDIIIITHGTIVSRGMPDDIRQQTGEQALIEAFVKAVGAVETSS